MTVELTINGRAHTVETDPDRPLLDVLREDLGLTGAKYGCGEGQCRACTVLLDGNPVPSCLTAVSLVQGKQVQTIEGLASGDGLHPVQEAFIEAGAMQCGYCAPGMILAATALLERNRDPSEDQIKRGLNANLCRCCGYTNIVKAVKLAARAGRDA